MTKGRRRLVLRLVKEIEDDIMKEVRRLVILSEKWEQVGRDPPPELLELLDVFGKAYEIVLRWLKKA